MSSALDFFAAFKRATGGSCSSTGVLESRLISGFLGAGRRRGRAANDVVADSDRLGRIFKTPCATVLNDHALNIVAKDAFIDEMRSRPQKSTLTWRDLDIITGQ
jgi:hypothetical protein